VVVLNVGIAVASKAASVAVFSIVVVSPPLTIASPVVDPPDPFLLNNFLILPKRSPVPKADVHPGSFFIKGERSPIIPDREVLPLEFSAPKPTV
jgi:hypothetical protein